MKAKDILAGLALPLEVAHRRGSTMSILEFIRLRDGKAAATNLFASVEVDLPLGELACCAQAQKLSDALETINSLAPEADVKLSLKGKTLTVSAPGVRHTLATVSPEDFPMPKWPEEQTAIGSWQALVSALQFAVHAAAKRDNRPMLNGVATRDGYIGASDGHRGAIARGESQLVDGMIVPTDAVPLICKLPGGKSFSRSETTLAMQFDTGRFSIQLVAASFPDLARIVPAAHSGKRLKVERLALERSVTAVGRTRHSVHLRFTVHSDMVKLEAGGIDGGGTVVEVRASDVDGEWAIDCNAEYLRLALAALDGEHVTISQEAEGRPVLLTGAKESRAAVIMPWRA